MIYVGFLYNCSMKTNPRIRLGPSVLNRAVLIDRYLRDHGMRIFFYSPKHISSVRQKVPGYLLEGDEFLATSTRIPTVNGNWTYQTRRLLEKGGMGYQRFIQWTQQNGIGIYVPHAFSELIVNKYETYKLVRAYHENLHPHSERYRRSSRQIQHFIEASPLTFIKPHAGSKGDGIITIRRRSDGFRLTYYENGQQKRFAAKTALDAAGFIRQTTRPKKEYIVQKGVETVRYQDSVFDVRVLMFHDGQGWNWLHEARLSPSGSDLSNMSQGGSSLGTDDLLFDLLGNHAAQQMLEDLRNESFGLAAYLERLHPTDLMEVAFDFVIDRDMKLRLVEINTKPGLAGIGFVRSIYDMRPEDEPLFERWVYPHAAGVARFLSTKVRRLGDA